MGLLAALPALFVWFLAVLLTLICIFFVIFLLLSLVDVEDDHINPMHMCEKANKIVIPEYACQGAIVILFFITGHWIDALVNLPLLCFHIYRINQGEHLLDPTCIFSKTKREKYIGMGKFLFYIFTMFYYLYQIIAVITKAALGRKFGMN